MGYSGAWRKLIHEKNQKQKISWHCPFKNTWATQTCVHLQAGMCKCRESANSLLFSEMHEIHGKHTVMQRWGILESSQKCFFVVQALINNYIYKVNAYMTHTTYMIFDWYVD